MRLRVCMRAALLILRAMFCAVVACARIVVAAILLRLPGARRIWSEQLATFLAGSGPVLTKVGQHLSARTDILSDEMIAALRGLRDTLPPPAPSRIEKRLSASLGIAIKEAFAAFDWAPVGLGSIAVVYRATTRRERADVAVKVLRPGIEAQVEIDTCLLQGLGRLLDRLNICSSIPFAAVATELSSALRDQVDLRKESLAGATAIREAGADIRIPAVLTDYSSSTVMVMEFVAKLRRFDDPEIPLANFRGGAVELLHALYRMLFIGGAFHCDLHASNVLFDERGKVVLLDWGLVQTFTPSRRIAFRALFRAISEGDGDRVAEIVLEFAHRVPTRVEDGFRQELCALVSVARGRCVGDFRVAAFVGSLFQIQRRYGIVGAHDFVWAILALVAFEGLVLARYPELDFQEQARDYFVTGFIETVRVLVSAQPTARHDQGIDWWRTVAGDRF